MVLRTKTFHNFNELQDFIAAHNIALFTSSKTSTVIPYDKIESLMEGHKVTVADLSQLPKKLSMSKDGHLIVRGGVTWDEAKDFLHNHKRSLKTYPTEVLATITAGVATSCTGERSFGFGNLRKQIVRLKYMNFEGHEIELRRDQLLSELHPEAKKLIEDYANDFNQYRNFKNAPYPRFEQATDLMVGSEGQLGIVTEVEMETAGLENVQYMFMLLPSWEDNFEPHLELHQLVQQYRGKILSCELVDHTSISFLAKEDRLGNKQDVIFIEMKGEHFDEVYSAFLEKLKLIHDDSMFEIKESRFHHIRASVPRRIFEENSRAGVVKMGTDVQVSTSHFKDLLQFYREARKVGIAYNLFGHFGDAHLHFNFMPRPNELAPCQEYFHQLYQKVLEWKGSPFAEHGIGFLKKNYIKPFQGENEIKLFRYLKKQYDPHLQFFPQGFMNV
ncbi:MAG: FAD-binding oxidoreductase [Bacteriovoracaceae bacterium]